MKKYNNNQNIIIVIVGMMELVKICLNQFNNVRY